ncbi:MAG TPA: PCRF domain-containing protein [Planctomycetota bacterium]|nr:PCRF domain-containing protein [Planctomycetota bacterium]
MWEEIEKKGTRYQELKSFLESSDAPSNPQYANWLREYGRLTKFGELWDRYTSARKQVADAEAIISAADSDPEFKALAKEELDAGKATMEEVRRTLIDNQLNEDDDSSRNVIVEIHAGVGGQEAALFVGDLYEMYRRFSDKHGWKLTELEISDAEMGGLKEVVFRVEGDGAFGKFRFEGGGHRVQRVPKTETQGRVHTSMARVAVLPEAEEVDIQIDPKDVRESFCAAGGPGGQNVNKVASQCQLLHEPTGILVRCMETRSAQQNKVRAWQILRSKLYALKKAEADKSRSDQRLGQIGSGDRSERVRTYNFPQGRVTDHRIEGEDKNWPIQEIVSGELDALIRKLEEIRRSAGVVGS